MRIKLFSILVLFSSLIVYSQNILLNETGSSEKLIDDLKNSKTEKYNEILTSYNAYILANPNAITAQIERCKFIGNADYDTYEDYNPNYDQMIACIDDLVSHYPTHPEVLLYKLDYTWGDETSKWLGKTMTALEDNKTTWTYQQQSRLYEKAFNYYVEDNDKLALIYADKAERLSDSLDLSVAVTEAHLRLGNESKAKEALMNALYYDSQYPYTLKRKGELLIDFNEIEEATKMFERANNKDSTITNNESFYKIYLERNDLEKARSYLLKDTLNDWNKASGIQKLVDHDISYSSFDTAILTYRRMQTLDANDDYFGIKRLRLFFKSPIESWTWNEILSVLCLGLLLLMLFALPYLWVLPIYGIKTFFKIKLTKPLVNIDWNLKHFWLVSFAYLLAQTTLVLVFYYEDYINEYFEVAYTYGSDIIEDLNVESANANLFFFLIMLISTALFLNRKRLRFVFNTTFSIGKIIGYTVCFVIINAIVIRIATSVFSADDSIAALYSLNSREEISGILTIYGFTVAFIAVVVIVPFYEEVIFRGIILTAVEKHIGFIAANSIQSILFALVHMNFQLFLFYFVFGMITGYMVKKSKGLLVGYIFHAFNNLLVLISITVLAVLQN